MGEILQSLSNIFSLFFIVGSMIALGLSLFFQDIIAPLRNWSLVWRMLLGNFLLVPILAFGISQLFSLDAGYETGMIVIGLCAGAPFIPKLIEMAHGDVASSVGVMVLLLIGTVIFVPIALPLLMPSAKVDPMQIAGNLVVLMFLPLAIALLVHTRYQDTAGEWQPFFAKISNIGLIGVIITMLLQNGALIVEVIGTGLILASALLIAGAFLIGMVLAAPRDTSNLALFGFSTAQRNVAASMVIASQTFSDQPNAMVVVIVMSIMLNLMLLLGAAEWGKSIASNHQ